MTETKQQNDIEKFLARLQEYVRREDRGALSDLRHGFSKATEYRALKYLPNTFNWEDDRQRHIWLTIAAGFATHKSTDHDAGNIGATLRKLALGQGADSKEKALQTFDARFRRLLTCTEAEELCDRLVGVIRASERKGIGIDYERLFWDLQTWHKPDNKVKIRWAQAYWEQVNQEGGDES